MKTGVTKAVKTAVIGGLLAAGAVLVPATAAHATPSNCSGRYEGNSYWANCTSGTGYYRATVRCYRIGSEKYTPRYGLWKKVHQGISVATCLSSEEAASGGWQLKN
ncbi:hypothetical protein Sru01_08390 [Sphaerisporangium rufum]|uniref:Uncharacterized protein n=1 Tax=Sphaerisporangium rufum TaxID=1381558 RepID=A0A919QXM6_9ACTN|nr:hypothetical protein [Sphaerisporangium rufum]GII75857.1 hypothetical protein Sru01_08390 [Sphaerisporangium rufum]